MQSEEQRIAEFLRYSSTDGRPDRSPLEFAMHLESEFHITLTDSDIDTLRDALCGTESGQARAGAPGPVASTAPAAARIKQVIKQVIEEGRARRNGQN